MLRTRPVVGLLVLFFAVPLLIHAQSSDVEARIAALLAQIQSLQNQIAALQEGADAGNIATIVSEPGSGTGSGVCPLLNRTLGVGNRGEDVVALQRFLLQRGFFNEETTGYFGSITEAAVRAFQTAHNVVSSGSPTSTGWGLVGPRTTVVIAQVCQSAQSATPTVSQSDPGTNQCPAIASATPPQTWCGGSWERLISFGCHTGWRCALTTFGGAGAPVIDAIEGPTTISEHTFTTWRLAATDPDGQPLSYSVTWGDENALDILSSLAGYGQTYTQSSSISHAYQKVGTYTVDVSVKDASGNVATATFVVTVTNTSNPLTSAGSNILPAIATTTVKASCITPWASQVVHHLGNAEWQPFFTNGLYFNATSTPFMRCENGAWMRCRPDGTLCQIYEAATSTQNSTLQSYANIIGTPCASYGATKQVTVPPGTQLCQWLSCSVAESAQTITLTCQHSGWSDTNPFRNQ